MCYLMSASDGSDSQGGPASKVTADRWAWCPLSAVVEADYQGNTDEALAECRKKANSICQERSDQRFKEHGHMIAMGKAAAKPYMESDAAAIQLRKKQVCPASVSRPGACL